ncbi:hypothetical protein KPLM21_1170002 [Klebsiella pneumoniae]|nr:hypothetical protein KPLM21_1170002 [Klebsiella pneumoniae]
MKSLFNYFFYRARMDKNRSCPAKASNYEKIMNATCCRENLMEKVYLSGIVRKIGKGFN